MKTFNKHYFSQAIKDNIDNLVMLIVQTMIWCNESDTAPVVFLTKWFLWLIMRKIPGKSQLRDIYKRSDK